MRSRLAVVFICARAFSIHISYSPSSSFYSPYMPPLFPRLGVIRSHADAFNLRERLFSICHFKFPSSSFRSFYMPPLFLR